MIIKDLPATVALVDMDDTLAISTPLTRILWRLSRFIYKLGILAQRSNLDLSRALIKKGYKVIILTGRTDRYKNVTSIQTRKCGLQPAAFLYFNEKFVLDWKKEVVELLSTEQPVVWIDDQRDDSNVTRKQAQDS